jgi:hypothetical protein
MTEVLIGTEWIEVEESLAEIEDLVKHGSDDPLPTPLKNRIRLIAPSRMRGDQYGRAIREGRKEIKVAVSAINAIREDIPEG